MNPSALIALSGIVFLVLFSLSLFLFIVVRRLVTDWQKDRFEKSYRRIENDILQAISLGQADVSSRIAARHKHHLSVLTRVLLDYGDLLTGEGRTQLQIIFDRTIRNRCLKSLNSRRTIRRLQNARLFVIFFSRQDKEVLLRLLQDKPIIKLAVLTALSRIPSPEMMNFLFQAFEQDPGSASRIYFNIMFSLGTRVESLLREYLRKPLPIEKVGLLVELAGAIPVRSVWEEIVRLASHPEKEIRIKVARALGNLLIPETAESLIALASDQAWEVQTQALKSLGKLKNPQTVEILVKALFSPHWYVRYSAAQALAEIGETGLHRLKEVAAQEEDRYARDMSVMILNELVQFPGAS